MASLTEVYENFSGNQENENMEAEPHSHEHSHEHTHEGNHDHAIENSDMLNNVEAENDNMLNNENDLNQEIDEVDGEMVDNLENDEVEIPDMDDNENIESFQGEKNVEVKESSQQIDMYKIMLFLGVPIILAAILYFLIPLIRKRLQ